MVSSASVEMTGGQARRATGKPSRGALEAPTPIREPASAKLARRRAREGADAQYARELERAVMTGLAKKTALAVGVLPGAAARGSTT